jgi:flagellar hook-associated protein 2
MINDLMVLESQPLTLLTKARDTITTQKGVYADLKGLLDSLQSSVKAMRSTEPTYTLTAGRSVAVSAASGLTVATATAGSSAVPGAYQVSVTSLAAEQRVRSDRQSSYNQALGLSGTILLGGLGETTTLAGMVNSFNTAAVDAGQTALAADAYAVETRNDPTDGWQFRLVDGNGNGISIKAADGSYTSDWQSIPAGTWVDTGRGLKFQFGSDTAQFAAGTRGSGAAQVSYTGKGASISIAAADSLVDIASKINHATYADGNGVVASIIDNQLVLAAQQSGKSYAIAASDQSGGVLAGLGIVSGGDFKNKMQAASDAVFTVNSLTVTRTKNSGLTDVIGGVTLNLAADAKDQSATLTVSGDTSADVSAVNTFLQNYNKLMDYLTAKVATTKQTDGTYKRGALAGDSMFASLRQDLIRKFNGSVVNSGAYKRLSDIGLSINDSFDVSISDQTKLQKALLDDRANTQALLDGAMASLDATLGRYTGTSGYLTTIQTAADKELENANDRISTMNTRLTARQQQLYQQFAETQSLIEQMTYQSQQFGAIYSSLG